MILPTMIYWLLLTLSLVTTLPIVVVCVEVGAAIAARRRRFDVAAARPRVDVLIPAHDEESGIAATLASVCDQLRPGDRVGVVADNCSDKTAEIARAAGAIVWERRDDVRRGKGFALEFGRERLSSECGDVAVIVDADCRLEPGTLDALAYEAAATGRPVQADYIMTCPTDPSPRDVVSQLAVTVKNRVRQRGTAALGGAAVLTGSGMAFPWGVFRRAKLDGGNIVEDMQLSFDLLIAGDAPLYCGEACVVAPLPKQRNASLAQRTRWEHGHLQTLVRRVPRLVWEAVKQQRPMLLGSAIDLAVPPLSLLVMCWGVVFLAAATAAFLDVGIGPLVVSTTGGVLLAVAMAATLARFGDGVSPWTVLAAVPRYIAGKIPIYASFLYRRQRTWVRTDRDDASRPHLATAATRRT
jgi:cellulose synthase/poly-beta-1,6-N-acetylglucosamine synthase-like glycosyltransferase